VLPLELPCFIPWYYILKDKIPKNWPGYSSKLKNSSPLLKSGPSDIRIKNVLNSCQVIGRDMAVKNFHGLNRFHWAAYSEWSIYLFPKLNNAKLTIYLDYLMYKSLNVHTSSQLVYLHHKSINLTVLHLINNTKGCHDFPQPCQMNAETVPENIPLPFLHPSNSSFTIIMPTRCIIK
jgi:hypothetical protein